MADQVIPDLSGWRVDKCIVEFGPSGAHCILMLERGGPPRIVCLGGVRLLSASALSALHGSSVTLVLREVVDDAHASMVLRDASGAECLEATSCEEPTLPWGSDGGPNPEYTGEGVHKVSG